MAERKLRTQDMSTVKLYKPVTPAQRFTSVVDYKKILTTKNPYKKLLIRKARTGGRNSHGKITTRHIGGGYRKLVRILNYKLDFSNGFKVLTIEYDPNRSAFLSLVSDPLTGVKSYIIHSRSFEVGKTYSIVDEPIAGNIAQLSDLPVGTEVCQVEMKPKQGVKAIRSAGSYGQITAQEERYTSIKLPSGEVRKFLSDCKCIVGRVGNSAHELVRTGKAGRNRNKGRRPTVRGKVMNPVDHPHGGGEARNSIGMKYPKTPWGKHALGVKTRDNKKPTRLIVKRRK